jgi:hypothetical protein
MTRTLDWSTGTFSNFAGEPLTMEKLAAPIEAFRPPEPSVEALEQASFLGFFAFGVPCCAGWDGRRIRVVALEPVSRLDLNVARMKLRRWYPELAEVVELAAAGRWR